MENQKMKNTEKNTVATQRNTAYLMKFFQIMKVQGVLTGMEKKMTFNHTELRMLSEILSAKYENKRLISTQIADRLGITRSAVSQIVNRMEKEGVLKRVPDAVDRKIAYVEISEQILSRYGKEINAYGSFIGEVVNEFGEEEFDKMQESFVRFANLVQQKIKRATEQAKNRENLK
jgi:DNA-binding MarR family transcriptional regulator